MIPATIRNKNPGAQYPGRVSKKFGSRTHEVIGGGHKIATFPSSVHGAAALMYLLATSKHYKGKLLHQAIATWSGGNHVNSYLKVIEQHTGLGPLTYIDDELINDEGRFVSLAKAMAYHETGREYPMDAKEWHSAYATFKHVLDGGKLKDTEKTGPQVKALEWAIDNIGEEEIAGSQHNPFIVNCFAEVGRPEVRDDETAWCAAFLGTALKRAGYAYIPKELVARSYLQYGKPLDDPEVGAICVMWRVRPDSWQGHVAFVEEWTATTVTLVGGNQNDAVTRMTVPRVGNKSQVLGYRRAIPEKTPVSEIIDSDSVKYKATTLFAILSTAFYSAYEWFSEASSLIYALLMSLWTDAPEITHAVSDKVSVYKKFWSVVDLPWPVYASAIIALLAVGANLWSTFKRKRNREDVDTIPTRAG